MKTETALKYEEITVSQNAIPVIVVAAGSFTRMQGINKQLAEIGGVPVIIRTLAAFEKSDKISNVILVVRADDIFSVQLLCEKYSITKLSDIVCGGANRTESVLKGMSRVADNVQAVLIHDGARPLVSERIISDVTEKLKGCSAVTCGVPVTDTVKETDPDGKVLKTLDRSRLISVQTPQGVKVADYRAAIEKAGEVSLFTDDMAIMENAGFEVLTVTGDPKNIKITTPADISLAKALLEEEKCE